MVVTPAMSNRFFTANGTPHKRSRILAGCQAAIDVRGLGQRGIAQDA